MNRRHRWKTLKLVSITVKMWISSKLKDASMEEEGSLIISLLLTTNEKIF